MDPAVLAPPAGNQPGGCTAERQLRRWYVGGTTVRATRRGKQQVLV